MKIPFHKTHTGKEEIQSLVDAAKSGWLTMGPKTVEFEQKFKEYIGAEYAVSVNSATAALHLALKAVGLKQGDEVIIPTNTFVATAEVVTYFNAIPVLCDIEVDTHNMDVTQIERLITSRTKAIIPVHFGGQPCDMDEIIQIALKFDLRVIEDAAHSFPSKYKNTIIGNLKTDVTCFSFYATKTLSTGEGGMAITNHEEYFRIITVNRLHGISNDAWSRYTSKGSWYYEVIDNGNKYNSTDLNAALGLAQLKKTEWLYNRRKHIAHMYTKAFQNDRKITPVVIKNDRETSWHLFVVKVDYRDEVIEEMKNRGIGCSVHFIPIHMHPYYKNRYVYSENDYPVSNYVFKHSLSLPIYPDMSDEEVNYVICELQDIVAKQ